MPFFLPSSRPVTPIQNPLCLSTVPFWIRTCQPLAFNTTRSLRLILTASHHVEAMTWALGLYHNFKLPSIQSLLQK
ncbi:hypothetical protein EYC84_007074 [Monilinia fructicola]|uniref:Uncharacterized protein n=1 Tax=Monilinia fructicola TaxID=38448 RepID=A0A5M9K5G1_MONFR|nr:hypothetical protein EYC84_007074 [Monilinia fructicola]